MAHFNYSSNPNVLRRHQGFPLQTDVRRLMKYPGLLSVWMERLLPAGKKFHTGDLPVKHLFAQAPKINLWGSHFSRKIISSCSVGGSSSEALETSTSNSMLSRII